MFHKLLILLLPTLIKSHYDCSQNEHDHCVRLADPLIQQSDLIFPDTSDDINTVCHTWNEFVDCLRQYTEKCFNHEQKQRFNDAVESPIETVHRLCMNDDYRIEYLHYAPCIKSTVIDKNLCGHSYQLLVEQVSQNENIVSKSTLCCSHDKFRRCIENETRKLCDGGVANGPAEQFATQTISKALKFLGDQCENYVLHGSDCNSLTNEIYTTHESRQQPQNGGKILHQSTHSTIWSTSPSANPIDIRPTNTESSSISTQILGSRTRPASYGRSSGGLWSQSSSSIITTTPTTNQQFNTFKPRLFSSSSSSPDWMNDWSTTNENLEKSSTWYPVAGSHLINEIDEPNQQGWSKTKNSSINKIFTKILGIISIFILVLL